MKKLMNAFGKCVVYFSIYFLSQLLCSLIALVLMIVPMVAGGWHISESQMIALLEDTTPMIMLMSNSLCIGVFWLTAVLRRRSFQQHVCLYPLSARCCIPILLLGITLHLAIATVVELIPFPDQWIDSYNDASSSIGNASTTMLILSVSLIGPLAEELLFRGLIYTRLRNAMPGAAAALISSLLFGLAHGTVIWFFYTFVVGLICVWCFQRFRTLLAPILLHITFNLISIPLPTFWDYIYSAALPLAIASTVLCALCMLWICRITPHMLYDATA